MIILWIVLAILFPPLAVLFKRGLGMDFLINVILTLLIFLPGMIHALWIVTQKTA